MKWSRSLNRTGDIGGYTDGKDVGYKVCLNQSYMVM